MSDAALHALLAPYGTEAAPLAAILPALGWRGDLRRLAESMPVLLGGRHFDAVDLLNVLAALGFDAQSFRPRAAAADETAPLLFLPKRGAPRLLSQAEDPEARGRLYRVTRRGVEEEADRHARMKLAHGWVRSLSHRMGPIFRQVAALSALSTIFALAVPLFVMMTYDRVIGAHAMGALPGLILGAAALLLAEAACFGLRVWAGAWFSARVGQEVGAATFERLLALPALYTERATPAAQILRLKAFETARDFFGGPMLQAVLDAPFVLILLAVLALVAGPLALVPPTLALVYAGLLLVLKSRLRYAGHRHARAVSERQQLATETFARLEAIRADGLSERWQQRFARISERASLAAAKHQFLSAAVEHGAHALLLLAVVTTLTLGIDRVWSGAMSTGALIAAMILIWRILGPLHTLCALLPRFEHVRQAALQIDRLMAIPPESTGHEQPALGTQSAASSIVFSQVALRYNRTQDPVFAGLSATIRPGELIAVTGSNGVGKSSVLKLVQGLYTPAAGSIRLDGADLRQLDPVALRRRVAYLPQAPQFISGSLLDNLRLGRAWLSEDDAGRALEAADAWSSVMALPQGLATPLGPHAVLPAGLAQRLHLARLYIGDESVLLIDELPNPLLESIAGKQFLSFLRQERGRRTVLFVTHREDHLTLADRVLWLRSETTPVIGRLKQAANSQPEPIHA